MSKYGRRMEALENRHKRATGNCPACAVGVPVGDGYYRTGDQVWRAEDYARCFPGVRLVVLDDGKPEQEAGGNG